MSRLRPHSGAGKKGVRSAFGYARRAEPREKCRWARLRAEIASASPWAWLERVHIIIAITTTIWVGAELRVIRF